MKVVVLNPPDHPGNLTATYPDGSSEDIPNISPNYDKLLLMQQVIYAPNKKDLLEIFIILPVNVAFCMLCFHYAFSQEMSGQNKALTYNKFRFPNRALHQPKNGCHQPAGRGAQHQAGLDGVVTGRGADGDFPLCNSPGCNQESKATALFKTSFILRSVGEGVFCFGNVMTLSGAVYMRHR
ncbi:Uncharacterised protein [Cedecea neteri]|uniref:Uncharacterized protein n=1 Tax=Cedecea neteri TaxID=158822 RepID=A0A2X3J004_9ENTR|nr:hypothetical protein [Cedecea neteri]SQC92167.1 Uncharacterised protein [Cedecea neteri]